MSIIFFHLLLGGCVDQASVGVVERWGRFEHVAEPGCHFFNPFPGQWLAGVLSTMINSIEVKIESKTKDNVFLQLICSIQYRVVKTNADDSIYELQNPRDQIQAYVFDVVRALVPVMTLDALFEQKREVAKTVLEELEKVVGMNGQCAGLNFVTVRGADHELLCTDQKRLLHSSKETLLSTPERNIYIDMSEFVSD